MQVPALCPVCGAIAKPAYTCSMCGMIVCSDCFDMNTRMCIICSQKFGRRKDIRSTIPKHLKAHK